MNGPDPEKFTETVKGIDLDQLQNMLGIFKTLTDSVNGIEQADTTKLDTIVDSMEKMGDDKVKNFIKDFSNKDFDTSKFTDNITNISTGLNALLNSFDNIDDNKKEKLESVKSILDTLSELTSTEEGGGLSKITGNSATSNLKTYADNLDLFAKNLQTFIDKLIEVAGEDNKLQTAIENFNSLSHLGETITDEQITKISNLATTMQTAATQIVSGFVNSLKDQKHTSLFEAAALSWATTLDTALKGDDPISKVKEGAESMISDALSALESTESGAYTSAVSVGEYVAQGFADGMDNKSSNVYQAAVRLAQKAMEGMKSKEGTYENSPSKKAFKIGDYVTIGLINGLKNLSDEVYNTSANIGNEAVSGLTKSISNISSIIENDMDTTPTIRPILDLSDVENGVGILNSMMDTSNSVLNPPSIGVFNNLNSISNGMNARRQNGGEIVDAIDRLGENLDTNTGDIYNINGVTIDSDEQVADAVQTLVRAVKVGRRS